MITDHANVRLCSLRSVTLSKRLTPTLLTDQVYAALREAIMSGELPAGSRLRVRDLAEQVGTSVMPVRERRAIDLLDRDEAMLAILYSASGHPVLVDLIRTLWQHCRAYKIVGAQGSLDAGESDLLWRYQRDLLAAAREQDGAAALAVSNASLDDATRRVRARLAEQNGNAPEGA